MSVYYVRNIQYEDGRCIPTNRALSLLISSSELPDSIDTPVSWRAIFRKLGWRGIRVDRPCASHHRGTVHEATDMVARQMRRTADTRARSCLSKLSMSELLI